MTWVHFLGLDCRLRPDICGPNASCMNTHKKVTKDWKYHQCVCNPGFIGNGITCVDAANVANGSVHNFKFVYLFTSSRGGEREMQRVQMHHRFLGNLTILVKVLGEYKKFVKIALV